MQSIWAPGTVFIQGHFQSISAHNMPEFELRDDSGSYSIFCIIFRNLSPLSLILAPPNHTDTLEARGTPSRASISQDDDQLRYVAFGASPSAPRARWGNALVPMVPGSLTWFLNSRSI